MKRPSNYKKKFWDAEGFTICGIVALIVIGLLAVGTFWSFIGYLAYLLVVHFTS